MHHLVRLPDESIYNNHFNKLGLSQLGMASSSLNVTFNIIHGYYNSAIPSSL